MDDDEDDDKALLCQSCGCAFIPEFGWPCYCPYCDLDDDDDDWDDDDSSLEF